jgi:hypothetical protein
MASVDTTMSRPEDGGIVDFAGGAGVLLIQACVIIPGLLPCLLLLLPLVLPVAVVGVAAGVLVGLPLGLWRLAAFAYRAVSGSVHRDSSPAGPDRRRGPAVHSTVGEGASR